jgi:uncharacterized membrane protein
MSSEPNPSDKAGFLLRSTSVLPLFDSVFGVALTLLAFSVPDHLMGAMDLGRLFLSIGIYILSGLAVLIYWYKLRRLMEISRSLRPPQLIIGLMCLLVIVLMPKFVQLVVVYGNGSGDFLHWTVSQIVNTVFLLSLFLFDGLCVLFAITLLWHPQVQSPERRKIRSALNIQILAFLILFSLGVLELTLMSFNNEYVLLVPIVLIIEEFITARQLARL